MIFIYVYIHVNVLVYNTIVFCDLKNCFNLPVSNLLYILSHGIPFYRPRSKESWLYSPIFYADTSLYTYIEELFLSVCENLAINNVTWYVNLLVFFIYILHIPLLHQGPTILEFIYIHWKAKITNRRESHRYCVFKIMYSKTRQLSQ